MTVTKADIRRTNAISVLKRFLSAVRRVIQTLCDFAPLQLFQTKLYDGCNNYLFINVCRSDMLLMCEILQMRFYVSI